MDLSKKGKVYFSGYAPHDSKSFDAWALSHLERTTMKNRICIVTSANTGIGLEIVRGLAKQRAHVVMMVCQNESKGEAALDQITKEQPDGHIDLVVGDLGTIASV
jgi:short-subunit dehydrogenase